MSEYKNIALRVNLGSDFVPESIEWRADSNQEHWGPAKAFLLSIFEANSQDTLKLDLWTKDFQMNEMDRFMYYTLKSLCESYLKATNNVDLANDFQSFIEHFGVQTELLKSS